MNLSPLPPKAPRPLPFHNTRPLVCMALCYGAGVVLGSARTLVSPRDAPCQIAGFQLAGSNWGSGGGWVRKELDTHPAKPTA